MKITQSKSTLEIKLRFGSILVVMKILLIHILFSLLAPKLWAGKISCNKAYALSIEDRISDKKSSIEKAFKLNSDYMEWYYARRIEPYSVKKTSIVPLKPTPKTLYRGMYISFDELLTIVKTGFDISKVKWKTGGSGVYFSSSARDAGDYIFHNSGSKDKIGIVIKVQSDKSVRPLEDRNLNPSSDIYKFPKSVDPKLIRDIYFWGEFGLENIESVIQKIENNKPITPAEQWAIPGR